MTRSFMNNVVFGFILITLVPVPFDQTGSKIVSPSHRELLMESQVWDQEGVSMGLTGLNREQTKSRRRVPRFEDFPTREVFKGRPAPVDLSSHPLARMYQTRLREVVAAGLNFAGHYAVVWWGCGNECGELLVVDLRTGKVYGLANPQSDPPLYKSIWPRRGRGVQTSRGEEYRINSKLLIVDPPCPEAYNPCVSTSATEYPVRYYVLEANGLKLIHKTPCRLVNWRRQQCGS